jgi:hypothetical protein
MNINTKTKLWWMAWIGLPLLIIAWQAAPEWVSRSAMLSPPWRDVWFPLAQQWSLVHPIQDQAPEEQEKASSAIKSIVSQSQNQDASVSTNNTQSSNQVTQTSTNTTNDVNHGKTTAIVSSEKLATPTPTKVLMLGDSLMGEVAAGMRYGLPQSIVVIDKHKSSTGLANRGYYDWPEVAKEATQETQPTNVVIHLGGNDAQDIFYQKKWLHFGSPEWIEIYKARADEMISNIKAIVPNVQIIWVGLPEMEASAFNTKIRTLASVQKDVADSHQIPYIDSEEVLGHVFMKEGKAENGRTEILRAPDGIHYSRDGGILIAREVALDKTTEWPWK